MQGLCAAAGGFCSRDGVLHGRRQMSRNPAGRCEEHHGWQGGNGQGEAEIMKNCEGGGNLMQS